MKITHSPYKRKTPTRIHLLELRMGEVGRVIQWNDSTPCNGALVRLKEGVYGLDVCCDFSFDRNWKYGLINFFPRDNIYLEVLR